MKNKQKVKRKNNLPKLASDIDFLHAFSINGEKNLKENPGKLKKPVDPQKKINKHGLPFLDDYDDWLNKDIDPDTLSNGKTAEQEKTASESEELFPALLEASFKHHRHQRREPKPIPLKKRLKRYPPPEADLDLHGFTAIGAQIKTRSFISSKHAQGFFTLRIIVGKGIHSEEGPVLPHVVEDLLKEMKKENVVLAFKWEGSKKLKLGAVLVYLKRFDD